MVSILIPTSCYSGKRSSYAEYSLTIRISLNILINYIIFDMFAIVCYVGFFTLRIIGLYIVLLTDTAMLISEITRFDSFYIFSTELLVFLLCRQTDKEFRLPWPSFVSVEIYYKYRFSINRKYRLPKSWIFHSEVVRALTSRPRGHEFESRTIPFFPYQWFFFSFPCFSFFLNFEVKQCGNLYWKYDNTGFAMEK